MNQPIFKQVKRQNFLHSLFLLLAMLCLMAFLGYLIAGLSGLLALMVSASILLLFIPQLSTQFIMYIYGAQIIQRHQLPVIYKILQMLSSRAGLEQVPRLYYLPSPNIVAFSVGTRGDEAVILSDSLLRKLTLREISAVMAHEISHIYNRDIYVMMLADLMSRFTALLSLMGYFLILIYLPLYLFTDREFPWLFILILVFAPNLSALLQLALSRTREFSADLNAARLTGDPQALISALKKIEFYQHHWLETVMMPKRRRSPDPSLLRTHPETSDRIERLNSLVDESSGVSIIDDLELDLSNFTTYHRRPERRFYDFWFR